jgi:hypothetical protein
MFQARFAARCGTLSIVQQRSGMDDLQVGALHARQPVRHAIDTLNVREIVHRVGVDIPFSGLF